MSEGAEHAEDHPPTFDMKIAHQARIYNHWLGGSWNLWGGHRHNVVRLRVDGSAARIRVQPDFLSGSWPQFISE